MGWGWRVAQNRLINPCQRQDPLQNGAEADEDDEQLQQICQTTVVGELVDGPKTDRADNNDGQNRYQGENHGGTFAVSFRRRAMAGKLPVDRDRQYRRKKIERGRLTRRRHLADRQKHSMPREMEKPKSGHADNQGGPDKARTVALNCPCRA